MISAAGENAEISIFGSDSDDSLRGKRQRYIMRSAGLCQMVATVSTQRL